MEQNIGKNIIIGTFVLIIIFILFALIITGINSNKDIKTTGGSYSSDYSSSYSGGSSSSSSYKSKNPADYDSKGNYKPVESMTQEEKRQELIDILEDSIY